MYNKLLLLIAPVTHGLLLEFFWTDGCSGAPFNPTSSECSLLGGGTYGKHRMLLQEISIALRVLAACGGAEEGLNGCLVEQQQEWQRRERRRRRRWWILHEHCTVDCCEQVKVVAIL